MNFTDILILLGLAVYMVLGFRDGFLKKVFAILGLWGGLVIATKYMVPVGELFLGWFGWSDEISRLAGPNYIGRQRQTCCTCRYDNIVRNDRRSFNKSRLDLA